MTSKNSQFFLFAILLSVLSIVTSLAHAGTKYAQFIATVSQSPFSDGDLAVGKTVSGLYSYDSSALPDQSGSNYAQYNLIRGALSTKSSVWSANPSNVTGAHNVALQLQEGLLYQPADFYDVAFYGIQGPAIQGYFPQYSNLYLIDTDSNMYATNLPPIGPPDVSLVEAAFLDIVLSPTPTSSGELVRAQLDSIRVFDPTGNVTGSGWIESPPTSFAWNPASSGKANFNFSASFQPNTATPNGSFQFSLQSANMRFNSTDYDFLIVEGANAQILGTGTINGFGFFRFLLTVADGDTDSSGPDRFRLRIWDGYNGTSVFDSKPDAPSNIDATNAIGGGSIGLHRK